MQNSAPVVFPVIPEVANRWSPVIFSPLPVPPDQMNRLFEAARWAASSANEQPWSFVMAMRDQPEMFEKLAACLHGGNAWAKQAPVLALSVARMVMSGSKNPNRYAFHDTGMALGNLLAQATADGLIVHQMGGFDVEKARTNMNLPEHHDPVAMIAIGYYGDPEHAEPGLQDREKRPRARKAASEFVFRGAWGKP